jgi:hypothetical protein
VTYWEVETEGQAKAQVMGEIKKMVKKYSPDVV